MEKNQAHSDQKYIQALLNNDSILLNEMYRKFAPKVVSYIKKNSGDDSKAQDIIQETLITIYNQAKEKKLVLTCPFDAYFFLLCKRKWLNELKKNSVNKVTINEEVVSINDEGLQQAEDTLVFEARNALFAEVFDQLGNTCKELLKATFAIKSMEKVAEKLGQSYGYVRKKKSLCIGKLTKMMQSSPKYNKIKNLL